MTDYAYTRMPRLLRLAPWVDLPELQKRVLHYVHEIVATLSEGSSTTSRALEYEIGERATLPSDYRFQDAVSYAMNDLYVDELNEDPQYYEGVSELIQYFTEDTYWRRV